MYKTSSQNWLSSLITNITSAELLLPLNDDYIIEVKAVTDGGDGISSEQIKIPKLASKFTKHSYMQGFYVCMRQTKKSIVAYL